MTGEAFKPGWDRPGPEVEPAGYLRRARYSFTDLLTGEHREGVWDQESELTPEEVAHQVFRGGDGS